MKFLLALLFSLNASAALFETDKQNIFGNNYLQNGGFENGRNSWSASAGTFAVVTSGSNLLDGKVSATWDSSATGQTLRSNPITVPNGLAGKPGVVVCSFKTPSGTATHLIEAYDGTKVIGNPSSIVSSATPVPTYAYFLWPSSGTVQLEIKSVASNEPLIAIDDCYAGDAIALNAVSISNQDIFSAQVDGTVSPSVVSNENRDFINGNCTRVSAGNYTCNFVSGVFSAVPNCYGTFASTADVTIGVSGTTTALTHINTFSTSSAAVSEPFTLVCQRSGADTPSIAVKASQAAMAWSGHHDSTCSWARTNVAYGDFTADASCTLVEDINNNFGTVTSVAGLLPGITFTPNQSGVIRVCAKGVAIGGSSGTAYALRIIDSAVTQYDDMVISGGAEGISSYTLCAYKSVDAGTSETIKLQGKGASASITLNTGTTNAIQWSVMYLSVPTTGLVLQNQVVTPYVAVLNTCSGYITNTGSPVVTRSDGGCAASVTDNGVGNVSVNFAANTFSSTPNCTVSPVATSSIFGSVDKTIAPSSSSYTFRTWTDAGSTSDQDFTFMCMGPK